MTVSHPILDAHDAIAWDMDGTLSDEHHRAPNAEFFRSYIKAHPEKRHHVVTFRDRQWANQIWTTLREYGVKRSLIRSVESCPELIHDCFQINRKYGCRPDFYMNTRDLTPDQFLDYASQYTYWKGLRAKQIGCTILVDDIPHWVEDGCTEHGIEFLHAHHPC